MEFIENKTTELKVKYTKSMLKTVSSFANYHDGIIYIGVEDNGSLVGVLNEKNEKLKIETSIHQSLSPLPDYEINVLKIEGKTLLEIIVYKGDNGPYYYDGKAYKRQDTADMLVTGFDLTRLILMSKNLSFDKLDYGKKDLSFNALEKKFKKVTDFQSLSHDVLVTLDLLENDTYNNAAALLSDEGPLTSSCIDLIKFDLDTLKFQERLELSKKSILDYYDHAMDFFDKYYTPYEIIENGVRISKESVPKLAFRETIANALVHRDYIINDGIKIAFFDNRIEVLSPGGLPPYITEETFFNDLLSSPRNPVIAFVFLRLKLIEKLGTGITKIIQSYRKEKIKPSFLFFKNAIKTILPVIDFRYDTLNNKSAIHYYIKAFPNSTRQDIEKALKLDKSLVIRELNQLIDERSIQKKGSGPSTFYRPL